MDDAPGERLSAEAGSVHCPALGEVVDVERCHTCPWWVQTRLDARGDGEVRCRVPPEDGASPAGRED